LQGDFQFTHVDLNEIVRVNLNPENLQKKSRLIYSNGIRYFDLHHIILSSLECKDEDDGDVKG